MTYYYITLVEFYSLFDYFIILVLYSFNITITLVTLLYSFIITITLFFIDLIISHFSVFILTYLQDFTINFKDFRTN